MNNQKVERLISKEMDPGFARRARVIAVEAERAFKNKKVKLLDIGCGRGWYEQMLVTLLPKVEIVAIDQNEKYLSQAIGAVKNNRVKFEKTNAGKLPFKKNSFDGVLCTELLEHVGSDKDVISEIYRVLKPGGKLLVSVPHHNYPLLWDPLNWILERTISWHIPKDIWWLAGIWADHLRLYSESEFCEKLVFEGFGQINISRTTHYCAPLSHFLLYGIGKNLVERGWLKSFNRFNFEEKESNILQFVKAYFRLWDKFNDRYSISKNEAFLNLVGVATKI